MKILSIEELDNNLRVKVKVNRLRNLRVGKVLSLNFAETESSAILKVLSIDHKNKSFEAKKAKPAIYVWTTESYRKSKIYKVGIVVWQTINKRLKQTDTTGVLENIKLVEDFPLDIPNPKIAIQIETEIHNSCVRVRKDREAVKGDWQKEIRPIIINTINKYKAKFESVPEIPSQRYYQTIGVEKGLEFFKENQKGWMQWACGTGKSFQGFWLYKALSKNKVFGKNRNGVVILLVPSRHLDQQTSDDWHTLANATGEKIRIRKVVSGDSSDPSVLKNEDEILGFLKESSSENISLIACTYHSSQKLFGALKRSKIVPDFVIYDEAHRITGETTKSWFRCLLDSNLPAKRKLFMTASPIYYTAESLGFAGMNNVSIFGNMFHRYQQLDAVFDGYITPLEILGMAASSKTIEEIKEAIKVNEKIVPEGLYNDNPESEFDGYTTFFLQLHNTLVALKEKRITHPIIYANSIKRIEAFMELLVSLAPTYGVKINYHNIFTGKDKIKSRIIEIEGPFSQAKIGVVGNARCLQEGISINKVDSIVLIDPRFSGPDIIQILGRPVRLCEGKKKATIILPVLCEYDSSGNLKIDRSYFSVTRNWMISITASDGDFGKMFLEKKEDEIYFNELTKSGITLKRALIKKKSKTISGKNMGDPEVKNETIVPRFKWSEFVETLEFSTIIDMGRGVKERRKSKEGKNQMITTRLYNYFNKFLVPIENYLERKSEKLVSKSSEFIKTPDEHINDYAQINGLNKEKVESEFTSFHLFNELVLKTDMLRNLNLSLSVKSLLN